MNCKFCYSLVLFWKLSVVNDLERMLVDLYSESWRKGSYYILYIVLFFIVFICCFYSYLFFNIFLFNVKIFIWKKDFEF